MTSPPTSVSSEDGGDYPDDEVSARVKALARVAWPESRKKLLESAANRLKQRVSCHDAKSDLIDNGMVRHEDGDTHRERT